MNINKNSPIPVYYQVMEDIREKINNGIWKIGQCIDSERELSENYCVSRMTVRQALGELAKEGILIREKGKGTFVCEPKVKQRDIMSFTEIAQKSGLKTETEILDFCKISTPEFIKDVLAFDYVYKIRRLRAAGGEKIGEETVYIPDKYCQNLDINILKGSLYRFLEEQGHLIYNSESNIQALLIDNYYKSLFNIDTEISLLKIRSKNFTEKGEILFVEESIYRADKYLLEVNIFRREGKIK